MRIERIGRCVLGGVLLGGCCWMGLGQEQGALPKGPEEPVFTLHAYTSVVQVPVLVLNMWRERMAPVDMGQFFVSLNGGRRFRPSHVRREGDDPLSVAIVIDTQGGRNSLHATLAEAFASLVPGSLHAQDRVSVYELGCTLRRFARSLPADPVLLRTTIGNALGQGEEERAAGVAMRHHGGVCGGAPLPALARAAAAVVNELSEAPGRRVVVTISNHADGGAPTEWLALRRAAALQGVTLFAVSESVYRPSSFAEPTDYLGITAESSGGLVLTATARTLPATVANWVAMLRERYILDLPRPVGASTEMIDLQVTLAKRNVFLRASGNSFAIADPKVAADPTTVPGDLSKVPEVGTRRPLGH